MRLPTEAESKELRELNRQTREGLAAAAAVSGPRLKAALDSFVAAMAKIRIDLGPLQKKS